MFYYFYRNDVVEIIQQEKNSDGSIRINFMTYNDKIIYENVKKEQIFEFENIYIAKKEILKIIIDEMDDDTVDKVYFRLFVNEENP